MALFGKKKNDSEQKEEKKENIIPETPKPEEKAEPEEKTAAAEPVREPVPVNETPAPAPEPAPEPIIPEEPKEPAPISRGFTTPIGFDFNRYFLAERRIVLENVSYETNRVNPGSGTQFKLGVKDTIVAQVLGQAGVKITYNRALRFEPEGPFTLSVSFSVLLVFNPGTRGEIDWHTIDVAEEFKKNCPALVQAMASKAALLVAEITNANAGTPIIPVR